MSEVNVSFQKLSSIFAASVVVFISFAALANDDVVVNPKCKAEPENQCAFGELRKAKLAGKDLHDGNYDTARMDESDLSGANLSGSSMQIANLQKANLSKANLKKAHLHAANLTGANLSDADLQGAILTKTALMGANLKGANLDKAILTGANLSGATWIDGHTCAPNSISTCK
jgi:uncharacterized protein YjbI with pentapeptide repeats